MLRAVQTKLFFRQNEMSFTWALIVELVGQTQKLVFQRAEVNSWHFFLPNVMLGSLR